MDKQIEIFGENPPELVKARIDRELAAIFDQGFSSLYGAAREIIAGSIAAGYPVGSRGSIGSSLCATLSGITEVNPLPAHYICRNCRHIELDPPEAQKLRETHSGLSGFDLPDKPCPVCGTSLTKDGNDISFEIFFGYGDKEPDIDLNFSGDYQSTAHAHAEEIFGKGQVFKAGTISAIAEKTALGFVNGYLEKKGLVRREAEKRRLAWGITGVKRTTGQHPGGVMIVPKGRNINEFCPVQRPADNQDTHVLTTHFDYHSALEGRLLKLDILGHDAPTVIKLLSDYTGVDPNTVDLGDKKVMALFTSSAPLGLDPGRFPDAGTLGIPEFGTSFVQQMLADARPKTFTELVKIAGLSHGTDVWLGNAQELIRRGTATLNEIISARDDILIYLCQQGVENRTAFNIMEKVRKGKGVSEADESTMRAASVPDWYIESCQKIQYLFPKGHSVAYVMMSVRIAWFKIFYPQAFYAATFSVKTGDIDYETMCLGPAIARRERLRILSLGRDATARDQQALSAIDLVLEMYERGLNFRPIDVYRSEVSRFLPDGTDGILPALTTLPGLGQAAAQQLADARKGGEFISREDFKSRTKVSKTVMELFARNGLLLRLPETDQMMLEELIGG